MIKMDDIFDESIEDGLRVTMVATGLNSAGRRQQKPELRIMTHMRDGTTGQPVFSGGSTGSDEDDGPAVFSSNGRRATVEAMKMSGVEEYDIPAFLRKQAD